MAEAGRAGHGQHDRRDRRGHRRDCTDESAANVSFALVKLSDHRVKAATDARDAAWFAVSEARGLAFDHDRILSVALERLKGKIKLLG